MRHTLAVALTALLLAGCGAAPSRLAMPQAAPAERLSVRDVGFVKKRIKQVVEREFKQLDANGDQKLSKKELSKKSPLFLAFFQTVDTNMDGYVTLAEFHDRMAGNMEVVSRMLYAFMDTNNDGTVTGEDYSKFLVALMDDNRDRRISYEEFQSFITSPGMINPPW